MKKNITLIIFAMVITANCTAQGWAMNIGKGISRIRRYMPIAIYVAAEGYNRQMDNIRRNTPSVYNGSFTSVTPVTIRPSKLVTPLYFGRSIKTSDNRIVRKKATRRGRKK